MLHPTGILVLNTGRAVGDRAGEVTLYVEPKAVLARSVEELEAPLQSSQRIIVSRDGFIRLHGAKTDARLLDAFARLRRLDIVQV